MNTLVTELVSNEYYMNYRIKRGGFEAECKAFTHVKCFLQSITLVKIQQTQKTFFFAVFV